MHKHVLSASGQLKGALAMRFGYTSLLLTALGLATAVGCGMPLATPTASPAPTATVATITPPAPTETAPAPQMGTLEGRVSVGPLCPVEPCPTTTNNPYIGHKLRLTSTTMGPTPVPIEILLADDGTFRATVPAGTYRVDVTACLWLGCSRSLPVMTTVQATQTTMLNVDIDTGIR